MGRIYKWNKNPFQDFLIMGMWYGNNIADKEFEADIYVGFSTILEYLIPEKDSQYLDFEIKKNNNYFKVVGKNIITALWLSGIFPKNPKTVLNANEFIVKNIKYKFDSKTNRLTHQFIKK